MDHSEHRRPDHRRPDHRRLGRQLGIFGSDELCGAGLPLWLPAGATIRSEIERFIVDLERRHGYQHVYTPMMAKRELYERSGHWDHYHEDMYPPMQVGAEQVVLRPMNCPHHILVFEAERPTVRHVPYRIAELGTMFRNERSGVVGGLSRVRQMTLNDGHVFCLPSQLEQEITAILAMVNEAYRALDIPPPDYRLSRRGAGNKYVDNDRMWERSEQILRSALGALELPFTEATGEAAFYGPKIDLQVTDPQGRQETLSTIQVDFHLPSQFELEVPAGDEPECPVMIHRSIVSTMERMVAHLLEVHNGALPVWLAPIQARIIPIVDDVVDQAIHLQQRMLGADQRVDVDDRDATLGARIRDAQHAKIPYVVVIGRREVEQGTVAVRLRGGRQLDPMPAGDFIALLDAVRTTRSPTLQPATTD